MSRTLHRLVVVALAAVICAVAAPATATATPVKGAITGVVTGNGAPLAGVTVQAGVAMLFGSNPVFEVEVTTTTGADGRYALKGVPAEGDIRVQFVPAGATGGTSPTGYGDRCFGGGGNCATAGRDLTVVGGQTTKFIDVALTRAGQVKGRLTDALGRGVGNIPVYLYEGAIDQEDDGVAPVRTVKSDVNGNYVIPRLWAHSYGLCFSEPQAGLIGTPNRDGYFAKCRTSRVTVTAGQITTVDTQLKGGGGVTGVLVDSDSGQPVAGAQVELDDGEFSFSAVTGADGTFRLGRVTPGPYTLTVMAFPYFPVSDDVTVRALTTTDVGQIQLGRADD